VTPGSAAATPTSVPPTVTSVLAAATLPPAPPTVTAGSTPAVTTHTNVGYISDGDEYAALILDVYLPERADVPLPTGLVIHHANGTKGAYKDLARHLAEQGYAIVPVDYRPFLLVPCFSIACSLRSHSTSRRSASLDLVPVKEETHWATTMLTANVDGSDIVLLEDSHDISHLDWLADTQLLAWSCHRRENHCHLYQGMSDQVRVVGAEMFDRDGHCSFSPDRRWMLTDTHPDPVRSERALTLSPGIEHPD